jgi:hypothetical protein
MLVSTHAAHSESLEVVVSMDGAVNIGHLERTCTRPLAALSRPLPPALAAAAAARASAAAAVAAAPLAAADRARDDSDAAGAPPSGAAAAAAAAAQDAQEEAPFLRAVLLLVVVRLGLDALQPVYIPPLLSCFRVRRGSTPSP